MVEEHLQAIDSTLIIPEEIDCPSHFPRDLSSCVFCSVSID